MADTNVRAKNEIWKNVTPGVVFVRKLDHRGELTRNEQVDADKQLYVTTEERQLNMQGCANPSQDPFLNGTLQPIRLQDDTEDADLLRDNPNVMTEADMKSLVTVQAKTFEARLARVMNPVTLQRLLAVAYDEDASVKRVERIRARLTEVGGGQLDVRVVADPSKGVGTGDRSMFGKPVSPR